MESQVYETPDDIIHGSGTRVNNQAPPNTPLSIIYTKSSTDIFHRRLKWVWHEIPLTSLEPTKSYLFVNEDIMIDYTMWLEETNY